jgi:hypothetical protein
MITKTTLTDTVTSVLVDMLRVGDIMNQTNTLILTVMIQVETEVAMLQVILIIAIVTIAVTVIIVVNVTWRNHLLGMISQTNSLLWVWVAIVLMGGAVLVESIGIAPM